MESYASVFCFIISIIFVAVVVAAPKKYKIFTDKHQDFKKKKKKMNEKKKTFKILHAVICNYF